MSNNWLLLTPNSTHTDSVLTLEPEDYYQFQWEQPGSLKLSITGLSASVDLRLSNEQGQILQGSEMNETSEGIFLNDLLPGTYYLEIIRRDRDTNYTLNLDPITGLPNLFGEGMSQDTPLNIQIAYGDKKTRELGIFSLSGMDQFVPNTPAYFQEAARRILSQSNWGQVLISNANQAASLVADSFDWESQVNDGVEGVQFRTSQTVNLLGEQFGLMIVPKGTIQQIWENPNVKGSNRPSFSFGEKSVAGFIFENKISRMVLCLPSNEKGEFRITMVMGKISLFMWENPQKWRSHLNRLQLNQKFPNRLQQNQKFPNRLQ